jgi:hypothetical protein
MSKPKFVEGPNGQPVAVEYRGRKGYEKKIEKLSGKLAEARGVAVEARMKLARVETAREETPPIAAPPPAPAPAPRKTHRQVHQELRARNPYLAAQYVLNHQHELDEPGPEAA